LLEANGVESHVVDPASIAVLRRHRRAKTDAIDGETLLRTLMACQRGEPRVCAMTVPFVTIRNTPELTSPLLHMDWHSLIGIPHGKKIFIHAGSIADSAQVPEILGSVSYWPENAVLLLHNSRSRDESFVRYRKELSHLDLPNRVFWSSDLLPEDKVNSLISACTCLSGVGHRGLPAPPVVAHAPRC